MSALVAALPGTSDKSRLDRALSLFADVRAGEGAKSMLMLVNIFVLLICYSVIKTVREPLILLGGGAEVRSYAAAGQALLLMGFVPLYSWFASRVDRARLLVGATLFFIACIELFALAVAARVPYVGVAFFIWVGIFNMSLVAQFWSFANDIYSKEDGDRLFPIIAIGMTAGAPIGSFVSARLFRAGAAPQAILQISAVLLAVSVVLYLWINSRETKRAAVKPEPLGMAGGFGLVLRSSYLRLIALLIVLLNVVNTTGEYVVARLLTAHVNELALADAAFDKRAYIGAFSGEYQFWVNVTAFLLQAFVTSRLVKHRGVRGALLMLPLIALGGYAIIAAGVGFSVVRWIKTAENATDYSVMNTARQLLWLPTSRDEKYKAKQAIDTFFVRGGDLLSAGAVFLGTSVLHLGVADFAMGNVVLTLAWIGVALMILRPVVSAVRMPRRRLAMVAAVAAIVLSLTTQAGAQETREAQLAAERAEKAQNLHPYVPDTLERRILAAERFMTNQPPVYLFMGSALSGGGPAFGPGVRARYAETGTFNAHAAWSLKNYKAVDAALKLPELSRGRLTVDLRGNWVDAPKVAFYGIGNNVDAERSDFAYRATTIGAAARVQASRLFAVGGGVDSLAVDAGLAGDGTFARGHAFAEIDSRTSPSYTSRGGLYRVEMSDYRQKGGGLQNFRRVDAEVNQFVPLMRENWVLALRALVSTTDTTGANDVPFYLMPDLGGSRSLRGYPTWRFRDRNRLLLTGEYRWTAGSFVDMALFADAGKVAARTGDLDLSDLKKSYGLGISLHAPKTTLLRLELARGSEGTSLSIAFRPSF
jgi:AAA family ATP:ADP antiporter